MMGKTESKREMGIVKKQTKNSRPIYTIGYSFTIIIILNNTFKIMNTFKAF